MILFKKNYISISLEMTSVNGVVMCLFLEPATGHSYISQSRSTRLGVVCKTSKRQK